MPDDGKDVLRRAIAAAAILCGQHDESAKVIASKDDASEHDRVQARLRRRLDAFYKADTNAVEQHTRASSSAKIVTLEEETGRAAVQALQAISEAHARALIVATTSSKEADDQLQEVPLLGARDAKTLRILLSIVGNWGLLPLVSHFDEAYAELSGKHKPGAPSQAANARFVELPSNDEQRQQQETAAVKLASVVHSVDQVVTLFRRLLRTSQDSGLEDIVASGTRTACAPHLLAIGLRLGWCPPTQRTAPRGRENGTALVKELLKSMPTAMSMKALSAASQIAGAASARAHGAQTPLFVKVATERIYSAQLLRPDGVLSLLRVSFANVDANERGLMRKLTSIGHLLSTPPPGMPSEVFVRATLPRLLEVVGQLPDQSRDATATSLQSTNAQKDAACFALARQREIDPITYDALIQEYVYKHIVPATDMLRTEPANTELHGRRLLAALLLLHGVAEHAEPSSDQLSAMLKPMMVPLFSILAVCIDAAEKQLIGEVGTKGKTKQSDVVAAREVAQDLLKTWLKLSDPADTLAILMPTSKSGLFALHGMPQGTLLRSAPDKRAWVPVLKCERDILAVVSQSSEQAIDLVARFERLATQDIKLGDKHSEDRSGNESAAIMSAFDVSPSSTLLASLLKGSGHRDIASRLLMHLLEAYQLVKATRNDDDDDPMLSVLYLQHIMQLCDTFGTSVLTGQPDKVLSFINFALQGARTSQIDSAEALRATSGIEDVGLLKVEDSKVRSGLFNIGVGATSPRHVDNEQRGIGPDDADEDDDELKETALSLLLSLLEGNASLNHRTHKLLVVIQAQVETIANGPSKSLKALAREASLVLTARGLSDSKAASQDQSLLSEDEKAFARGRAQYQEALNLLQDPILPVRAHGLIMLKDLVASGSKSSINLNNSHAIKLDEALLPAILDIFIKAVCDDESFLYLNAVQGLAAIGSIGKKSLVKRLVSIYVGQGDAKTLTQAEVDKRLRLGEALLQVVQKLEDALSSYAADIVDPLLTAVRNSALPTTLRSSMLSILGTCIEASPLSVATQGYAAAIATGMLDLLALEMQRVSNTTQAQLDDALETSTELPQLRRAALLLLILLVRGATHQLQDVRERKSDASLWPSELPQLQQLRMPGGAVLSIPSSEGLKGTQTDVSSDASLFSALLLPRLQTVVGYVQQYDADALVRHQAGELLQDVDNYRLESVHSGANLSLA